MNFDNYSDVLHSYLNGSAKPGEVMNHVKSVTKLFDNEVTSDIVDVVFNIVFDQQKGFPQFVQRASDKNNFNQIIVEILNFLLYLVKHFPKRIEANAEVIRNVCLKLITSKCHFTVKGAALQVLDVTLELNSSVEDVTDHNNKIEAIYKRLTNSANLKLNGSTVHKQILITISIIIKHYPIIISDPEAALNLFISNINEELKKTDESKISLSIIEGGLEAIANYLEVFPFNSDTNTSSCDKIYNVLKVMVDPKGAKRKTSFRAALNLISQRGMLFEGKIFLEHEWWYNALIVWINSTNVEDQKSGFKSLNTFYKIIASEVTENKIDTNKEIFDIYFNYCLNWLKTSQSLSNYKIRLAIHGLGELSSASQKYKTAEEYSEILGFLMQKIEFDYVLKTKSTMDEIECLADYVKTLSNFLKDHRNINSHQINSLQQVTILIIKTFPKLSKVHHIFVIESLLSIIYHVSSTENISLEDFLEKILYQGIVITCSHHTITYAELHKEDLEIQETYKSYMPLWKGLLNMVNRDLLQLELSKKKDIFQKVYDELLKTLIVMINKLNLSVKWKSEDNVVTDLEFAFEATRENDHVVFVNLVDFYQEIFEYTEAAPFRKWIGMYLKQVIKKSIQNPLVSGFYKLLAYGLKKCDYIGYFSDIRVKTKEEVRVLQKNVTSFIQDTLNRMYNYKGDLLMSCLLVILNMPTFLIQPILPQCIPALINAFTVGQSYFKVATMAIDTLERLYENLPAEDAIPMLKDILPHLNPFISSKKIIEDVDLKIPLKVARKTKQNVAKKRIFIESEPEFLKLQKKILIFIGKLPFEVMMFLVESNNNIAKPIIWDHQENLKISLSFTDLKFPFYLDKMVPRIVELALSSGDRKTRTLSCELLHAIVMIMLGVSNQMQPTQLNRLNKLFKFIVGPLLKLGCDVDEFVSQLFNPLVMQLMHWYSNPRKYKSDETAIVIEALTDSITHETNSALRDFSGKCIREFLIWSIKQVRAEDIKQTLDNIRGVLRKINSFCLHPNPRKRLGAAMIFNNIYNVLREQEIIVDQFWLEIFYNFMMNFSLVSSDSRDDDILLVQLNLALKHIERPFLEKPEIFNKKNNKNRKIPPSFEGGTLKDVALWLLRGSTSKHRRYRCYCLETFSKFANLVPNCSSTKEFFKNYVDDEYLFQICLMQKNFNDVKEYNFSDFQICLESFLGLLDRFVFIFNNDLQATNKSMELLLHNLKFYLDKISASSLDDIFPVITNVTFDQQNDFDDLKFNISETIFNMISISINKNIQLPIFNIILWKFICVTIFEHQKIGLSTLSEQFETRLADILNLFALKLNPDIIDNFCKILSAYIMKNLMEQISSNQNSIPLKQRQLIKGMKLLSQTILGEKLELRNHCNDIFDSTIRSIIIDESEDFINVVDLQGTVLEYVDLKLNLGLQTESQMDIFLKYLCDERNVRKYGQTFGSFLFTKFNRVCMNFIVKNPEMALHGIMKCNNIKIAIDILKYCYENNTKFDRNVVKTIKYTILDNWTPSAIVVDIQLEILKYLCLILPEPLYLIGQHNEHVKNWIIDALRTEINWWNREILLELLSFCPCITGPDDTVDENLENALEIFNLNAFADFSDSVNSSIVFKRFLQALQTSHSNILLRFVTKIYISIPDNTSDFDLKHSFKILMQNLSDKNQLDSLNMIYGMCIDRNQFPIKSRYKIAQEVFTTLLHQLDYVVFESFYIKIVKMCLDTLKLQFNIDTNDLENLLLDKIISFMLMEVLFSKIDTSNFDTKSCPVTSEAFGSINIKTGKELVHSLVSIARGVRKESMGEFSDEERTELYRLYHCHAYNCLVSVVSNTSRDNLIYAIFFYQENNGEDILWKNLFSRNISYTFQQNFESIPGKRKALVNIRNEWHKQSSNLAPNYMDTQNIFTSTLSEDITKYDFTNTIVRNTQNELASQAMDVDKKKIPLTRIELEEIHINNHECMATVCGLIEHVFNAEIFTLPENKDFTSVKSPNWIHGICKIIMNKNAQQNAKLFLAKVIENLKVIFKHYAYWLLEPIMQLIVDEVAGDTINFFVADLVTMIGKWSEYAIPTNHKELATKLYIFLIKNSFNERQDLFKYNLDLIKTITEVWKMCIEIPHSLLFDLIQPQVKGAPNRINAGIHITAILLANGLTPWTEGNADKYRNCFMKILENTSTLIYKPCAEVIGMILNKLQDEGNEIALKTFKTTVEKFIKTTQDKSKKLNVLNAIHAYFPDIANETVMSLLIEFPNYHGYYRQICYKIILSKMDFIIANKFLMVFDWNMLLKDFDEDSQILALTILRESVSQISLLKVDPLMNLLKRFTSSTNTNCRNLMYEIFMQLYNRDDIKKSENLIKKCHKILVNGLSDNDSKIHERLFEFWSKENKLPEAVQERFVSLLQTMYHKKTEETYLGNCVEFIFSLLHGSSDFNKSIFDYPLWDCDFEEYRLLCHWRAQHASIAPMFADTLRQSQETQNIAQLGILRATQSTLMFEPTQSVAQNSTVNPFSSSLLLSLDKNQLKTNDDHLFKDPGKINLSVTYRRRFYKDPSKISKYCAYNEVKKHTMRDEKLKEKAKLKEGNVKVYRTYRIGDYPDIEIPLADVIVPLQNLAKRDGELAKTIYTTLFKQISNEVEDIEFFSNVQKGIMDIFTSSIFYFPNVIGSFLNIALNHRDKFPLLDPHLISLVARNSGLLANGCLLLEEYLISEVGNENVAKRHCGSGDQENELWVKLAELYKEMDESDVVNAIFSNKIKNDSIIEALKFERDNEWKLACEKYAYVINEDTATYRKDIYYESYFKCFAMLGDWDNLTKTVDSTIENKLELWDQDWKQNCILPWYIRAQLNRVLDNSATVENFAIFNEWLSDKQKVEHLKDNYSEELAIMALESGDVDVASDYLENFVKIFLNQWHHTNPLLVKHQINKLFTLQRAVDAMFYLHKRKNINAIECDQVMKELLNFWAKTSREILEPIYLNENKILQRISFVSNILLRIHEKVQEDEREMYVKELNKNRISFEHHLVTSALELDKFYVARKYVVHSGKIINKSEDVLDKLKQKYLENKTGFSKVRNFNIDKDAKFKISVECWKELDMHVLKKSTKITDLQFYLSVYDHLYDICVSIRKSVPNNKALLQKHIGTFTLLMDNYNLDSVHLHGVNELNKAIEFCSSKLQSVKDFEMKNINSSIGKCYLKLAYFMKNLREDHYKDFIIYTLRSMKFGSAEGRQLFPCLLNIKQLGSIYKETFLNETFDIATWTFLSWIPQLLAHLDSSNIYAVSDIVLRIAKTYPESIMYAYRLSKEKFTFDQREINEDINKLISSLDEILLKNELAKLFLQGLTCVCVPEIMLLYYVGRLKKHKENENEFQKTFENMNNDLFLNIGTADFRIQGILFNRVREKYDNKLKQILNKRSNMDYIDKELNTIETELRQKINKDDRITSGRLKSYSEFLHEFHSSKFDTEIEIPGQYAGDKLPLVQYHVKITSFNDEVHILKSMRKPMKITIFGNNAKSYQFLVKFGEDLRQDQRIQQIFSWMNNIFDHNSACRQRQLHIDTYQVIPLTSRLGIIEWIEGTNTLKSALEDIKENKTALKNVAAEYQKFINAPSSRNKNVSYRDVFGNACLKISKEKTVAKFKELSNYLPWNSLRRILWDLSVNSETFFAIRHQFVTSYSTFCIGHWYLGIGDRHLSNTLINLSNGRAIGIDFGHAFGSATQILQVPELVPFRLTPQIINLVKPFDETGLIQETMIHCVRSLIEHAQELISMMDVFIREPTLDWQDLAKFQSQTTGQVVDKEEYAEQKIKQASIKLKGCNPVQITLQELVAGHQKYFPEFCDGYKKVVQGDTDSNIRARKKLNEKLSIEEQVECLLDQATDANLLGRMYYGWEPYV